MDMSRPALVSCSHLMADQCAYMLALTEMAAGKEVPRPRFPAAVTNLCDGPWAMYGNPSRGVQSGCVGVVILATARVCSNMA